MSLVVTPRQLEHRAELYLRLAQLLSAGIPLINALETTSRSAPSHSFRAPLRRVVDELNKGCTFHDALIRAGNWISEFDIALLGAGEHSGRLDAVLRSLAEYYTHRARIMKQMISHLIYPIGLIHFAAFVFMMVLPFAASQFNASLFLLFAKAVFALSPLYLVTALLIYATQSKHGEKWRATIEAILHPIPLLGTARHYLALARLATALEALISAGVTIIEAWELAATASGSPALRRIVLAWKPQLVAGQTPSEVLRANPRFPEMFSNLYTTGEISGKLDESLRQLRQYYQEEGSRKLKTITELAPRVIYIIVMLAIAYFIIKFYIGHFNDINEAGKDLRSFYLCTCVHFA